MGSGCWRRRQRGSRSWRRKSMLAAEAELAEPMPSEESDGESPSDGEEPASEGEEPEWRRCRLCDCLCRWTYFRSCAYRRVAPGIDYVRLLADAAAAADHHLPAWSLLVGVADGASSSLRVTRLRVARSGRILGRSDDALDVFHDIALAKPPEYTFKAGAAPLVSDGLSLCVLHHALHEQPQALQLTLHPQPQETPLPEIEGITADHCVPISAGGHVWALSATPQDHGISTSLSLVMRRLVPASGGGTRWELVGSPFASPRLHHPLPPWTGRLLQGYAVIPDAKLILVSLLQYGLFLTFATDSGSWTRVLTDTDETRSQRYLPIFGRAIYVEHHKAVYFLRDNIIYAYKLTYQKDDQEGTMKLKMDLPVQIEFLCPFQPEQGYGLLTRLSSRLMCAVWISVAWLDPCPCEHLHAIVTTFYLHDTQDLAQGGIKALHSTFRQLDMVPNPAAHQHFCFLQEYEDQGSLVLQQRGEEEEGLTSPQHVEHPSKMLSCCRYMMKMRSTPPSGPSRSLPVDPASRQHVCS